MKERIRKFSQILKLRENDRQTEQVLLAEQRREQDAVLRRLEALGGEKAEAMDDFRQETAEPMSRQEIWFQRQAIEVIEKHIDKSREHFDDVRLRIEKTEERLVERHRDVRMIEGYVERLKADAMKELFDTEQLEVDDIAVTRYAHGNPLSPKQEPGRRNSHATQYDQHR